MSYEARGMGYQYAIAPGTLKKWLMHTKMYKINEVWLLEAGDREGINWTDQQRNLTRDSLSCSFIVTPSHKFL